MLVRGRKIYVSPTPFALPVGTAHQQTRILPAGSHVDTRLREAGRLWRREPKKFVAGHAFHPNANTLVPERLDNPSAGRGHSFSAFWPKGLEGEEVAMRPFPKAGNAQHTDEPPGAYLIFSPRA